MSRPAAYTLALALLAWSNAGCGSPPPDELPPDEAPPAPVGFHAPPSSTGYLFLEEGTLRFLPCGASSSQHLDDGTQGEARRLVQELGYGEDRIAVALVLDGMRLVEVRHAAGESRSCDDLLPGTDLEARGNEPFWNLAIEGERARWRTPDELDGVVWGEGHWTAGMNGDWSFTAVREGPDGEERLVLELEASPCRDTMAGFRFPFIARLDLAGASYEGCAVEGRSLRPRP